MDNDKIRICFVNPGINIRRPIIFIMDLLKKKNYRVSILTPRKKKSHSRQNTRHYDNFDGLKLLTYPIWTKSSGYIWPIPVSLEFFRKGWKILKENDIIHVWVPFYPNTFIICFLKLLFFKRKKLVLTMDTFPAYSFKVSPFLDVFFKIFFRTIGRLTFIASNNIVLYGNSFIEYARKAKVPIRKVKIAPSGINFNPKILEEDIRHSFNIKNSEKMVLFIGLYNKRKGIDLIIKTAFLLKDENIKFVLIGDGPEKEKSIKIIANLGLSEKVNFIGKRFDVHNFYNQSDIFFFPSRGEGLPGVLMEAMIYQVPIISNDISGVRDLVKHMENGFLCKQENILCYKKAIKRLLEDDKLRKKFKENGINMIKSNYLWKKNLKNFELIYRQLT